MGEDDALMEELAAAAVDGKLADALKSVQLRQEAAEIQHRVTAARLRKLEKAEPAEEDAIELGKLAVAQAANRVAQEAQRVSVIKAQVSKAAEQMALLPEEPEEERKPEIKVWEWSNAAQEEQEEWLAELHDWMHKTLFVQWPECRDPNVVPVCWRDHPQSVAALSALYHHWWKTYVRKVDEDLTGWWQDKWLETLTRRAQKPARLCGSIYLRSSLPHIHPYTPEYHALMEQRYEQERPYPLPHRAEPETLAAEPDAVPSTRERGDRGWEAEHWWPEDRDPTMTL